MRRVWGISVISPSSGRQGLVEPQRSIFIRAMESARIRPCSLVAAFAALAWTLERLAIWSRISRRGGL